MSTPRVVVIGGGITGLSLAATAGFLLICLTIVGRIFATGWKLRT